MRLNSWFTIGVAAVIVTAAVTSCARSRARKIGQADWPQGYSADITYTDLQNPSKSYHGKMLVNATAEPRGVRQDYIYSDRERVSLFRQTQGFPITLDPATKTYWKPKTKAELKAQISSPEMGMYGPQKLLETDNTNGRRVDHFVVTGGENAGWEYWQDQKLHAAVKLLRPGISTYELANIKEGRQPASLFEVPADYKEVSPPTIPADHA